MRRERIRQTMGGPDVHPEVHRLPVTTVRVFAVCILAFTAISCVANQYQLPDGWRLPLASDTSGEEWRDEDSLRYLFVRGDFNGDHITDEARLLARKDSASFGLFAFVSQPGRRFKAILLDEANGRDGVRDMGIKKVVSGIYKTACGKGYWPCAEGEMPEVSISFDAIDYFKDESANSYYFWDAKSEAFKRIWISD